MNTATVVENLAELDPEVRAGWRTLAELRENPFITPEWCESWLAVYPDRPFVVLWHLDGELRGVLPLVVGGTGKARELRFAGARRGDWFTPACDPADEAEMGAAVAALLWERRRSWSLLRLDRIDGESAWPTVLWPPAAGSRIASAQPRRKDVLPFIDFDGSGYEGYLSGRSRNFRSQLGRRRRKLEKEHELNFRMTTDPARLDADLDTFFALHEERWQERGGSSSGGAEVKRFQRQFATRALSQGWLRLWTAEIDGEAAAAWYGWRIGDRYCYSLSGLAKCYEPAALGTVLLAHTIEQAAAEGATVYDLMWGDEGYKRRFETGRREAATWVLGRRRHPVQMVAAARTSVERKLREHRER